MGTESLLARHVQQSARPADVVNTIAQGFTVNLDMGMAGERAFLLMASAGFDAEVVRRLAQGRKGHIRHVSYIRPIIQALSAYPFPELRVTPAHARGQPRPCRWCFAFNLPLYAFGLNFTPAASGNDGLLDVCTFERGSVWHGVKYLWRIYRQNHEQHADCHQLRGSTFRIEATDDIPVPFQVDGDPGGMLPVDIRIIPSGLTLLVPPAGAQRLGFEIERSRL
jgi:diacylglycerol kinase family enzyme